MTAISPTGLRQGPEILRLRSENLKSFEQPLNRKMGVGYNTQRVIDCILGLIWIQAWIIGWSAFPFLQTQSIFTSLFISESVQVEPKDITTLIVSHVEAYTHSTNMIRVIYTYAPPPADQYHHRTADISSRDVWSALQPPDTTTIFTACLPCLYNWLSNRPTHVYHVSIWNPPGQLFSVSHRRPMRTT